MVLGLAFVGVGINAGLAPATTPDHYLLHTYLPPLAQAALWAIPGLIALHAALQRGTGRDGYGFSALVVPLVLRIFSYLGSAIAYLMGLSTWPYAFTSVVVWLGLLALILIIAGWPEVPPPPRRRKRRRTRHDP